MASQLGLKLSEFPEIEVGTNTAYPSKIDNAFFYSYAHTNYGIKYIKRNYQVPLTSLRNDILGYVGIKNVKAEWRNTTSLWRGDYVNADKTKSYVYQWGDSDTASFDYIPDKFDDLENKIFFIDKAPIPMEETVIDPHPSAFKVVSKQYVDERHNGIRYIECTNAIKLRPYSCVYNFKSVPATITVDTAQVTNNNSLTWFIRVPDDFVKTTLRIDGQEIVINEASLFETHNEQFVIALNTHNKVTTQVVAKAADLRDIYERLDNLEEGLRQETTERKAKDSAIDSRIDDLEANLTQEIAERKQADNDLQSKLDQEIQDRIDGDEYLDHKIDDVESDLSSTDILLNQRIEAAEDKEQRDKEELLELIEQAKAQGLETRIEAIFSAHKTGAIYTTKFYNYNRDLHNDLIQSFERNGQKGIQYNNANCYFVSFYAEHTGRLMGVDYVTGDNKVIAADNERNRKLLLWRKLSEESDECEYLGCSDNITNYEVLVYQKYTFNDTEIYVNAGDNIYITSGNAGDEGINELRKGEVRIPTEFGTRQWRARVFDIKVDADKPNMGYWTTGTRRMHMGMPVMDITIRDSSSSIGIKIDDNSELISSPSTNVNIETDDYLDSVLFSWLHCNYVIDSNGDYLPTALENDPTFSTEDGHNVGVVAPTFYWKFEQVIPEPGETQPVPPIVSDDEELEDEYEEVIEQPYYTISISDSKHDDTWHPWVESVNSKGETTLYYVRPCYYKSRGADGKLHSLPGKEPVHGISLRQYKENYPGDKSLGLISQTLQQIFVAIKYASKSSRLVGFHGVTDNELVLPTGDTDKLVRKSDGSYLSRRNGLHPYRVNGIEHGIGNPVLATDCCVIHENNKLNIYDIRKVKTITIEDVRANGTIVGELPIVSTPHCIVDVTYTEQGIFIPSQIIPYNAATNAGYLDMYYCDIDQTKSEGIYALVLQQLIGTDNGAAMIGTTTIDSTTYSRRGLVIR